MINTRVLDAAQRLRTASKRSEEAQANRAKVRTEAEAMLRAAGEEVVAAEREESEAWRALNAAVTE